MEQAARNIPGSFGASHGEPQTGDMIAGKYLVEKVIGRGGMGRVLAAVHTATGKRVALKWILNEESDEARERFSREARAAGRIHHANVVDVYDVLEHEGAMCLVMELLRGESLASLLAREHTLPADVAVPLAVQIARGLDAAHHEGVIHRDLKPGNIFLTDGQGESGVKLLDFGISKILDTTDEPVTKSGAMLGTPHYMAPEQVLGMGGSDVRVDVYALGAVLYEMLAGRPPHTHEKVTALLVQIATVPTEPITEVVAGLSSMLGAVIMKALTKNPADRYPSVEAFAQALEPFTDVRFDGASGERRVRVIDRSDPDGLGTPSHVATLEATPAPMAATLRELEDAPATRHARAVDTPDDRASSSQPAPRPLVSGPVVAGLVAVVLLGGLAALRPWEPRSAEPIELPTEPAPAGIVALPSSPPEPGASEEISAPGEIEAAPAGETAEEAAALEALEVAAEGPRTARRRPPSEVRPTVAVEAPAPEASVSPPALEVVEVLEAAPPPTIRRTETPRAGRIGLDDF